jgi:putative ABC transport system permease protein
MLNDIRYAARTLTRTPGFTAIAILSMALGIGGTSAVFCLFRAVFLSPLPFPEPERLVTFAERRTAGGRAGFPISGHEYGAWKAETKAFERIAMFRAERVNLTGGGEPETIGVLQVSSDFFPMLGLRPSLGRTFVDGEDKAGSNNVVVLSEALWRRRFGADASIVDKTITLNDRNFTVVGVMPQLPRALTLDVWIPIDLPDQLRSIGRHNLNVMARLAPGVSLTRAQADVTVVADRLARTMPAANTGHSVHITAFRESLVGEFRTAMGVLFAAVGFVLLIACANLANLLLSRGAGRMKELALRAALGARQRRLIRELLVESVMLAAAGGLIGVLLAAWIVDLVPAMTAVEIPLMEMARVDVQALAVTAILALFTGILSGLAPAMRYTRATTGRSLIDGSRLTSATPERRRLRSLLVASEIAWTLMLMVGAGLMLNSFVRLIGVQPGFHTGDVLVLPVELPALRYREASARRQFQDQLFERLRRVPGVITVGATSHLPLSGNDNWMQFDIMGRPAPPPGQGPTAAVRTVTPDYFRTLDIPLRRGRFFSDADARVALPLIRWYPQQPQPEGIDRSQPVPVALVSEAAARQFWPSEDPIGRRIRVLLSPEITIVGVVGDVKHHALNAPASPHVYLAANQEPWSSLSFVVRTSGSAVEMTTLREQVRAVDPALPVSVQRMDEVRQGSVSRERFYVVLIGVFGAVALGLAIVGILGVVSHAARQRTLEIGVRLALGANRGEITRLIVGQGMRPIAVGVVVGAAGAIGLSRFMQKLLYGVEPADPVTFVTVTVVLVTVALLACWIPAARAARLDPTVALRSE